MTVIHHILLFDIDGTLIRTGGAGRRAMERAFETVHGIPRSLEGVSLGGKTDPQIYAELLAHNNAVPDLEPFRRAYFQNLREELPRGNGNAMVLPGICDLLNHLSRQPDCLTGLLTGNWQEGADIKLEFFGIRQYFHFGAFGDDAPDRRALPAFAERRARLFMTGTVENGGCAGPASHRFIVIGDTPRDIDCARHAGFLALAVATGEYPVDALAAHRPDFLLPDLASTGEVCEILDLPVFSVSPQAG